MDELNEANSKKDPVSTCKIREIENKDLSIYRANSLSGICSPNTGSCIFTSDQIFISDQICQGIWKKKPVKFFFPAL